MSNLPNEVQELIAEYLNSLSGRTSSDPCPDAMVRDDSLPSIYTPVAAYNIDDTIHALFMTGEYDHDDARLLAVTARFKAVVMPDCQVVFLNARKPGDAVCWLCDPTMAGSLVAAAYNGGQDHSMDTVGLAQALIDALDSLFGVKLARMKEGLEQLDDVLSRELVPIWILAETGRDLIRPLVRALNHLLRIALDDVLPPAVDFPDEPLMKERVRIWKKDNFWYRFQSLEYVEELFLKKRVGLVDAYQGIYNLNQNPQADVDRVALRILTAPLDPKQPDKNPFPSGGSMGSSSIRGEFMSARRTLVEQHGAGVPDLVWAVAECSACRGRSKFREEADPLTLYNVAQTMGRIKEMLVGGQKMATFYCTKCKHPLGFEHLLLAGYAHYMADLGQDLQFLNERRPGRRRTFIQVQGETDHKCQAMTVTDQAVAKIAGRCLSAVEPWKNLLKEAADAPKWRQFGPGFMGLALPPMDHMKFNSYLARLHDQLAQKTPGSWPVVLDLQKAAKYQRPGETNYPKWLGKLAAKVTEKDNEYSLVSFVDMDNIEALFIRSAKKLNVSVNRAFDGAITVAGKDLALPIDLKSSVEEAIIKGHFPGVFAVREAGRQAKRLLAGERTVSSIREYLGKQYSIRFNPITSELTIEPPSGLPVNFPFDKLVQEWAKDANKTRQMIIAKVGG